MKENEELRQQFYVEAMQPKALSNISSEIVCYRGDRKDAKWTDLEPGVLFVFLFQSSLLRLLCRVLLNVVHYPRGYVTCRERKVFWDQGYYYTQKFGIVLSCGLTKM